MPTAAPTPSPPDPVLDIRDLRFDFERHGSGTDGNERARHDAFELHVESLSIHGGRHTAIVGPSGCGKTTLLRLIAGILTPRAGTVRLAGEAISGLSDRARRAFRVGSIGMVFQDFALLEYLTALDNILLPYRINPALVLGADARARAQELARQTGIEQTLRRKPRRLSQGERQRVAICRALVTEPRVVLCDEPTGNLDAERSRSTIDLILGEATAAGATAIVVTHDRSLLGAFSNVVDAGSLGRRSREA